MGDKIKLSIVLNNATELERRDLRDRFSRFNPEEDEPGRSIVQIAEHVLTVTAGAISLVNALLKFRSETISQRKPVTVRHSSGKEIDLRTAAESTIREFVVKDSKRPKKGLKSKK